MERPAECCSVPRLTWFAGSHCARPAPQLHAEDFRQRLDYTIASGNWQLKNVAKTKKDALQARKLWYNTTRLRPSGRSRAAYGLVAQLGERSVRIREVEGSNPFESTMLCCQKMQHRKTLHESAVFSCFIRRFQLEKLRKMQFPNNWQHLTRGAQKRCRTPIFPTEVIRTPRLSKKRIQ